MSNKMYEGSLGGKPGRQNQNAQAKQHAEVLKKSEAGSSSKKKKTEPLFRKVYLTIEYLIRKNLN